ncbi:MAG: hypothetical protein WKG07_30900 [Hymenobacter sp.]
MLGISWFLRPFRYLAFKVSNADRGDEGFWRTLRRSKDLAVFAILLEDLAALLGLIIALAGVYPHLLATLPRRRGLHRHWGAAGVRGCVPHL